MSNSKEFFNDKTKIKFWNNFIESDLLKKSFKLISIIQHYLDN